MPKAGELAHNRPQTSNGAIEEPILPEMLVPRLGDYLLEKNFIRPDQLQHALDYQRANAIAGNPKMIGQIMVELGYVNQETLDRVITEQILALQNALKDTNDRLEMHVQQRTGALEWRLIQIRTAAEVAQRAISATRLEDLLYITVKLIVERFGYYYAAIYLLDDSHKYAVLREATGQTGQELKNRGYRIAVGSQSIIGWVTAQNETRVVSDVSADPLYLQDELLQQTRSEASIPLNIGEEIVGVLDVQSRDENAFNRDDIAVLQTLANQIASSIKTLRMLELTQVNLQEVSLMYDASSRIARANTSTEIFRIAGNALQTTPHINAVLVSSASQGLRIFAFNHPDEPSQKHDFLNQVLALSEAELRACFTDGQNFRRLHDSLIPELPTALLDLIRKTGCQDAVFLPVYNGERLAGLWFLGSRMANRFNKAMLQPYVAMAEFASTSLAKLGALEQAQRQLQRLQILNSLSQVIATELDVSTLFQIVHQQVSQLFGDTGFYIALYEARTDTISFPYLYEEGELLSLDPIPLGEGLTSHIIHNREPLLLVEDTERRAMELGAKSIGKFARSWMGVPLLIGEEVIGVMTVQDVERERAFSEDDAQLFLTLASQVSVAIRNARLVTSIRRRADQQRILFELTEKIRRSVDTETIMATTAEELARVLGARRTEIRLKIGDSQHKIRPANGKEPPQ